MEQSYKEKYEDILARLERAKNDNEVCDERYCCVIDDLIPELAESEDEKVRKGLIKAVSGILKGNTLWYTDITREEALAWLEKQGEHANFRDKIQVGDKVTRNEAGVLVNLSQLKRVAKPSEKRGEQIDIANKEYWRGYREGKKLILDKYAEIEKQGKQQVGYTTIVETGDGGINALVVRDIEIPFGAKDSELQEFTYFIPQGYYAKIEDDKVVIKKGEHKPEENKGTIGGISSNWSEEDGMILSLIVNNLKFIRDILSHDDKYTVDVGSFEGQIEWLQSLQDRVQPQPKQEWSEEDEMVRKDLIGFFKDEAFLCHKKKQIIAWLKKQGDSPIKWNKNTKDCKPQKNHSVLMKTTHGIAEGEWQGEKWFQYRWSSSIKDSDVLFWIELSDIEKQGETFPVLSNSSNSGKNEQKPAEWSEEDKKIINGLIDSLTRISLNTRTDSTSPNYTFYKEIDWLKSLRPQSRWKPTDEQMGCLSDAIEHYNSLGYPASKLKELLDDLKKIKEGNV